MKITEITPPFERKFTIEMTELELWQLRAIINQVMGDGIISIDNLDRVNESLRLTPDIEDKWVICNDDGDVMHGLSLEENRGRL